MGLRVLASYDRPNITADHVSWARRIVDSHGGKTVTGIEGALDTISAMAYELMGNNRPPKTTRCRTE